MNVSERICDEWIQKHDYGTLQSNDMTPAKLDVLSLTDEWYQISTLRELKILLFLQMSSDDTNANLFSG
jgi:hypothetical protein